MAGVWVYLERDTEGISEVALAVLTSSFALAQSMGEPLACVCLGGKGDILAIPSVPPCEVYHIPGEEFSEYEVDLFAAALEGLLARKKPSLLVFPPTIQGEDLASWLGAGLGVGVLLGASDVKKGEGHLVATRVEFDGKVAVHYELKGPPAIVTLEQVESDGTPPEGSAPRVVEVQVTAWDKGRRVRVLETRVASKTVDMRKARVIVGIGAGLGGGEALETARRLANILGGELGGTRAAVDAGWLSHDRQIGQTGVKVKPDLYIACGISGAVQHRVGIMDSGTIVAINIDPQAPIFRFSHYAVVGDVREVLPKLIQILGR